MANIEKLLKQALKEGYITCPKCKENLDPDQSKCLCKWKNPLIFGGFI